MGCGGASVSVWKAVTLPGDALTLAENAQAERVDLIDLDIAIAS
jgi:hypothetical protein